MSNPCLHAGFSTGGYRPHLVCDHCGATKEQQPMPAPQVWIGENSGGFGQFMPSTWGLTRS